MSAARVKSCSFFSYAITTGIDLYDTTTTNDMDLYVQIVNSRFKQFKVGEKL